MSAINPIINIQPPADSTVNSPSSSRTDADNGPSAFSKALSGTQDRPPPRKSAVKHRSDDGGANLPASGNAPPTAVAPPPAPPAGQSKDAPAARSVTASASASAASAPATTPPATTPGTAGAPAAVTPDPKAAKAAADAAAAAQAATSVALPDVTAADTTVIAAASVPPADVTAADKAGAASGTPVTTAPVTAPVVKSAAPAVAVAAAASTGTGAAPATATTAPAAPAAVPDPAATPAAAAPQSAADPAVAALLAQATTAVTDAAATKPSDSRVADATLQAPDSQSPGVGDAAGLTGASAAAPAFAATLAGAAQIATAVAGTSADKHDKNSPDLLATGALAAAAQPAPATAQTDAATPVLKVPASVDSPDFAQNVANQVSVMVDSKLTSAKLQVSPPSLGPIEVRIAIQGDHAQVSFSSHSALTRDALESSSPHLREMLGAQGFAQVSVDISHRSFQERTPTPQNYDWSVGSERVSGGDSLSVSAGVARTNNGLLDAYA